MSHATFGSANYLVRCINCVVKDARIAELEAALDERTQESAKWREKCQDHRPGAESLARITVMLLASGHLAPEEDFEEHAVKRLIDELAERTQELQTANSNEMLVGDVLDEVSPGWEGDYPDAIRELGQERDKWRAKAEAALDTAAGLTQDRYTLIHERDALSAELAIHKPSVSIEQGGTK